MRFALAREVSTDDLLPTKKKRPGRKPSRRSCAAWNRSRPCPPQQSLLLKTIDTFSGECRVSRGEEVRGGGTYAVAIAIDFARDSVARIFA
jgi:hypothetical protein